MTVPSLPHLYKFRVYFEDTDAGGIVYYANYLKFIERARTEMLRDLGLSHSGMMKETGQFFVVRRCAIDYGKPAHLDDALTVRSTALECGGASLTLRQDVMRGDTLLARAEVLLVHINAEGAPCRIPASIRDKIGPAPEGKQNPPPSGRG